MPKGIFVLALLLLVFLKGFCMPSRYFDDDADDLSGVEVVEVFDFDPETLDLETAPIELEEPDVPEDQVKT